MSGMSEIAGHPAVALSPLSPENQEASRAGIAEEFMEEVLFGMDSVPGQHRALGVTAVVVAAVLKGVDISLTHHMMEGGSGDISFLLNLSDMMEFAKAQGGIYLEQAQLMVGLAGANLSDAFSLSFIVHALNDFKKSRM